MFENVWLVLAEAFSCVSRNPLTNVRGSSDVTNPDRKGGDFFDTVMSLSN